MDLLCCIKKQQNSKDLENAYARRGSIVNVQEFKKSDSEDFNQMANVIVKDVINKAKTEVVDKQNW